MDMLPCAHRESVLSSDSLSLRAYIDGAAVYIVKGACNWHCELIVNDLPFVLYTNSYDLFIN